ncbi:hypothetical protein ACVW1B_001135 [Bradyrhizobium sp. USDA 4502]
MRVERRESARHNTAVVPAKAGTHNHEYLLLHNGWNDESRRQRLLRSMGPGLRRDDDVETSPG